MNYFCTWAYRFSSCPQHLQNTVHSFSQLHQSVVQLKVQAQQQASDSCPHPRLFFFIILILIFIGLHYSLPLTTCKMRQIAYNFNTTTNIFRFQLKEALLSLKLNSELNKKKADLMKFYVIHFSVSL